MGVILYKILVLHGPNLNLLGTREPKQYSTTSLEQINAKLTDIATKQDCYLVCEQTNAEHQLIDSIQQAKTGNIAFIILNAAAFAHTSIAIRDALLAVQVPFIEVHISNTYAREPFRAKSYLSDIAAGVIVGLGPMGYELALSAAIRILTNNTQKE